ncbi:MAG: RDD family protein [Candidatus Glassbacteria bacterium]|nr:RDD family protein [Candidatus Glassbacteria bacterium]
MLPTQYASFLKRFVAHIVDIILASILAALVVLPLALLTAGTGVLAWLSLHNFNHFSYYGDPEDIIRAVLASLPVAAIVFWIFIHMLIYWFYFAVFESSPRQATPGKMMLGMFVTDELGRRISFPRSLGRTVGKVLSQIFCWLGYIIALFTVRSQTLHDMMAGTLVLEPAYPAPQANTAPPQAVPPGGIPAPQPDGVAVPAEPEAAAPSAEPPTETTEKSNDRQPEENLPGDDKPEQENK